MNKSVHTITRLNLKHIHGAYIATIAGIAAMSSSLIINAVFYARGVSMAGNESISMGWAAWALPVAAGIIITARNFKRIVSLGGKRDNYFLGSLFAYIFLAAIASLLGLVIYYAFDLPYVAHGVYGGMISVPDVFGWQVYGPVVLFLRQFAFLFLTATFTHTFCAAQGKWYGWVVTAAFIAGICVFPPIEPLRNILIGYFYLIMFNTNALLHIVACIAIGLAIYMLNKPILARKPI